MLEIYSLNQNLPTAEELPDSDDTPVDNELQNLIPNLLKSILSVIWSDRDDWFFGVDMGIYDRQGQMTKTPIIPDAFLSLGVKRNTGERGRLSYVISQENDIIPILVLEVVSQKYGGEYDKKMQIYANLGILYYIIYNPHHSRRDKHNPFEIYRLENGEYILKANTRTWIEEIGLAIGVERRVYDSWEREWLYWYDEQGNRYLTSEERAQKAEQEAFEAQQRAKQLEEILRNLGIET